MFSLELQVENGERDSKNERFLKRQTVYYKRFGTSVIYLEIKTVSIRIYKI